MKTEIALKPSGMENPTAATANATNHTTDGAKKTHAAETNASINTAPAVKNASQA
jgi:hypothetical protein